MDVPLLYKEVEITVREEESGFASGCTRGCRGGADGQTPASVSGWSSRPIPTIGRGRRSGALSTRRRAAGPSAPAVGQRRSAGPRWGHAVRRPRRASDVALVASRSRASRRTGRLYHFSGGGTTADRPWSEQFITMQAARRETGTGWFSRRYFRPPRPAPRPRSLLVP